MAAEDEEPDLKEELFASDVMLHIGNAETGSTLPTASEYTKLLYDQIRAKELHLSKVRSKLEGLTKDNERMKTQAEALINERNSLRELAEERRQQLDTKKERLRLAHKDTTRTHREIESVKHRIALLRGRRQEMEEHFKKQQDLYQELQDKLHNRTMRKRQVDTKMVVAETNAQELQERIQRDEKVIRELEVYLSKITKQIYERQRQIDDLKLGQLDRKAEAEGLQRMIQDIESKQQQIQEKYVKNMAVRDRMKLKLEAETRYASNIDIEVERLKRRQAEEEQLIRGNELKVSQLEDEGKNWEKEWLSNNNKELEKNLELAEVNAENNVLRNRIERFRVLTQALLSEDTMAMYKAYVIGAPELDIQSDDISSAVLDDLIERRERRLKEVLKRLDSAKAEVHAKRDILNSTARYTSGDIPSARSDAVSLKSARSEPDLSRDLKAPKTRLARLDRRRKDLLETQEKSAFLDMNERKKRLQDECSLLTTQCNNLINEHERLVKEITHEKQRTTDLQQQIQAQTDSFEKEEKAEQERVSNLRREKEDRMQVLYHQLADVEAKLTLAEQTRNSLAQELHQAQVDEDNLRNRYNVYKGLRATNRMQMKQLENAGNSLSEWRKRVAQSEQELKELQELLQVSQERNQPTRRQLATLKPYDDESVELEALRERKKILQHQFDRLQRQRRTEAAEASGDITLTQLDLALDQPQPTL